MDRSARCGWFSGQIEHQLHGTDDAPIVLGDQERPATLGELSGNAPPERHRLVDGERAHETHGGAALYAVDQDLGKTPDLGLGRGRQATDSDRLVHVLPRSARAASRNLNTRSKASRELNSSGSNAHRVSSTAEGGAANRES